MNNPFAPKPVKHDDSRLAPGGVDGRVVDYGYTNKQGDQPPIVPYMWGQGFPTPWGLNYFAQWINQFLPTPNYVNPDKVLTINHIWPVMKGSDGAWQLQLNAGTPRPPGGTPAAQQMMALGAAQQQIAPASESVFAHGFSAVD